MQAIHTRLALGMVLATMTWVAPAAAQSTDELLAMDNGSLRDEIAKRYDAALAQTQDPGVVSADNSRFVWASQAKAQCGIALGFLKSGTKDPISVGKCADAYDRMQGIVATPAVIMTPPPPVACNKGPFIVFFDWDRSDISAEAASILDNAVATYAGCANAPIAIAGFTDRSGSDAYNQGLALRRADAARAYLEGRGIASSSITAQGFGEANPRVPTADGVRELQNRRVEITIQ